MYKHENRAIISLALIMAFRMLGLFMILPVFSVAATHIPGATPKLIGFAIGAYGLTQACLQIPFGGLSDKFGRKPIIVFGLTLFVLGSVVAALSHNITTLIIGRAIQGGGAVGSAVMAFLADLTRDERRTKAMATMGMSIGCSFSLALVLGTAINHVFGLSGIFWATALFGLLSIGLVLFAAPAAPKIAPAPHVSRRKILTNPSLLRLDLGIFSLHALLTMVFLALPIVLQQQLHLSSGHTIVLYLVVLALAFVLMVPFIIISEKRRKLKEALVIAMAIVAVAAFGLGLSHSVWSIAMALCVFFTAFSLMEASLPSLVSKVSPIQRRGAAMGIYSSFQFSGIFVGGLVGGIVLSHFGTHGLFIVAGLLGLAWAVIAISLPQPPYLSTCITALTQDLAPDVEQKIKQLPGVADVYWSPIEQLLTCKIDKKIISENELQNKIKSFNLMP